MMAFSEKEHGVGAREGGVTSAMMQQALSQIPPTSSKTNTTSSQLHELPGSLHEDYVEKGLMRPAGPIEDSLNEEPEVDFHGFPQEHGKVREDVSYGPQQAASSLFAKTKYSGSFTSSEDPRSPKSTSDFSADMGFYEEKGKVRVGVDGVGTSMSPSATSSASTTPVLTGAHHTQEQFSSLVDGGKLSMNQDIVDKLYNSKPKEKDKERKGLQR